MSWSDEGDVVLEIFGGSGTTPKMAKKNSRNWIYVDCAMEYCEIAKKRLL